MSPRALRVLREARAVYCEDTRRTRILMSHYGIHTPLVRYQDDNRKALDGILSRLRSGEDLALVSDSGTPVISDPGLNLVGEARAQRLPVCALPGPCAAAAAVAGSGLPGDSFVFLGFLPRSASKQRRILSDAAKLEKTLVIYESPFRVKALFEAAQEALGPCAQAAVCRELSKLHEEWLTGSLADVRAILDGRAELLGEFVVMFHPKGKP
jgi:16S rRNA (cytidine1402-2'-O)-methyltransferase